MPRCGTCRRGKSLTRTLSDAEFLQQAARDDLATFIALVMQTEDGGPAVPPRHLIEHVIPALMDDSLGPTVIIAPPGSAKTMTAIAACAWWIGRDPNVRMAYICNESGAAMERSTVLQNIIQSDQYRAIFDVHPDKDTGWAKTEWYVKRASLTDKNPTMTAIGWGGGIVGNRLDRAIIDDIADDKNMASELERGRLITFLKHTLMPRFLRSQTGRPIMIATRWHEDDPAQWAIDQGWHYVHFPALTDDGESYWPEQQPVQTTAGIMGLRCHECPPEGRCCWYKSLGPTGFELVMQGRVVSDQTSMFPRSGWRTYRLLPQTHAGAIFCDLAHSVRQQSDYTAIAVVATEGADRYFRHVVRARMEAPETVRTLKELRALYPDYPIVIEQAPNSHAFIQTLQRDLWGIIPFKLHGQDKRSRAQAVMASHEAGNWHLPEQASWKQAFIDEHQSFPNGRHDDMVDVSTMMELYFRRRARPKRAPQTAFRRAWQRAV